MRRCTMTIGAAVALVLLAVSPAGAAEYFVSNRGSDQAGGRTEQAAFATIAKGVSILKPGDMLTILPGEYFESVSARIAGKPEAPIVIRAKRLGTVLLRGDVDAPPLRRVEGRQYTYSTNFKPRVEGIAERSTRRLYEPMLTAAEVELTPASFYQDSETGKLYVHTSDSANPEWHALRLSVTNGFGILLTPPARSQTVHDVVIDGLCFTGYQPREFPPEPGSRSRWGLHVVMAERVVIRRCTSFLNSGGIFLLAPIDSVVEDCYAFGNLSRFQGLGNNILGWSVSDTTFRRNRVEDFGVAGISAADITFYGGERYDKRPTRGVMEANLAINAGQMVKGSFTPDTQQTRNIVVGRGAYFYRTPDATNLLLPQYETPRAKQAYADPINHDFRLQSDSPLGAKGPDGKDPGPYPYRDEVFYVSPAGNDSSAGTSLKQAWRTLAHACKSAKPCHTVYITAGEYAEPLVPAASGTADQPIRFLRYGRDRVVLDGHGRSAVGVNLSGKSHIEIRGLVIRNFARYGVAAREGGDLRLSQLIVTGSGQDGARFSAVRNLVFDHNLVRSNGGAGLRMESCPDATVTGNVLDASSGPRLVCDATTLAGLWSDGNAFTPGTGQQALIAVGDRSFASLSAWQQATRMDPTSIAAEPGYLDVNAERCDFALRPDSPLLGRGPLASTIGPYLRLKVKTPVTIENVRVHQPTDTTATVQWWTPKTTVAGLLQYGETPDCANKIETPAACFHTASLAGLKPDTKYFFRAGAPGMAEELRFAPYETNAQVKPDASAVAQAQSFVTTTDRPPPRTFHVALTGDDARSGLSASEAWRSIAHAAEQVRAGDTVLIHAGTYEEYVLVRATGDRDSPITFQAAPGETVWIEGTNRFRTTAFQLTATHHVRIDGIHFRHFRYEAHAGDVINIFGGSDHVIRRCMHDGRGNRRLRGQLRARKRHQAAGGRELRDDQRNGRGNGPGQMLAGHGQELRVLQQLHPCVDSLQFRARGDGHAVAQPVLRYDPTEDRKRLHPAQPPGEPAVGSQRLLRPTGGRRNAASWRRPRSAASPSASKGREPTEAPICCWPTYSSGPGRKGARCSAIRGSAWFRSCSHPRRWIPSGARSRCNGTVVPSVPGTLPTS